MVGARGVRLLLQSTLTPTLNHQLDIALDDGANLGMPLRTDDLGIA